MLRSSAFLALFWLLLSAPIIVGEIQGNLDAKAAAEKRRRDPRPLPNLSEVRSAPEFIAAESQTPLTAANPSSPRPLSGEAATAARLAAQGAAAAQPAPTGAAVTEPAGGAAAPGGPRNQSWESAVACPTAPNITNSVEVSDDVAWWLAVEVMTSQPSRSLRSFLPRSLL